MLQWSAADLAAQAAEEGLVESVARSTVRRWLDADAIRPWRYRSWIFPRDSQFAVKAGRVLDLYQRIWDGAELDDGEYVISTDEKSQLQILSRCHPGLPPAPGRPGRVEFEYERHGTVAYLAAYDVHRARLMGRVEPTTGIAPFTALVNQVMSTEPCASARRVFWIADNGSSHCGRASVDRMAAAWPNAVLVHLPVHASWLNQVEVVFSVIQRKVIKPSDIGDADALAARLLAFQHRYNTTARPFDWKFTRAGLDDLMRRVAGRLTGDTGLMASPPASTKTSLGQKLRARARDRWPQLAGVDVRFRGKFAYVTGQLPSGQGLPLCRLRYVGYASTWGFAIYRASHDDYQDNYLPSGQPSGTPEEALDCACGLYLADPTAWLPPGTDTPTN
jgi:hypothetical protein